MKNSEEIGSRKRTNHKRNKNDNQINDRNYSLVKIPAIGNKERLGLILSLIPSLSDPGL